MAMCVIPDARLRDSRIQMEDERPKQGFESGQEWVRSGNAADYPELKRLEELRDRCSDRDWDACFATACQMAPYGVGDNIYFVMFAEDDGDTRATNDFWESVVGDDAEARDLWNSDEFIQGFAEGALDAWLDLKSKLVSSALMPPAPSVNPGRSLSR
jgi:hypothetical protein